MVWTPSPRAQEAPFVEELCHKVSDECGDGGMWSKLLAFEKQKGEGAAPEVIVHGILS